MREWRETSLGEALEIQHGFAFKGEYIRDDGELIVLTPGNFFDSGGFKTKSGKEKYYEGSFLPQYLLNKGDVVVAMTEQAHGLLGSTATIPSSDRYLHNQRLGLLRVVDPTKLDLRFCYHLMNAPAVRQQIQATATGSKVRHTAPERIRAVRVHLPEIATQQVVAGVLDAIDDLIENNRRRVELLELMARAIYREWFVHFRYPAHEDATFVDSALGAIPASWRVSRLDEVAAVNGSSRKPTPNEVIRYLDISCLGDRTIGALSVLDGKAAPGRARRIVTSGDVVWSMVRPSRRAHALLVEPGSDWIASTGLTVLSPLSISPSLLFETVSATAFSDHLASQATGAAYPAVRPKDFEAASVVVPSREVDRRFRVCVEPQHRLAWTLRQESEQLQAIRGLLLPRLVTGQIEVSELDLDALVESVA